MSDVMRRCILFAVLLVFSVPVFAETSALEAARTAGGKSTLSESEKYLNVTLKSMTVPAEKRAVYAFLGSLYEQSGDYDKACASYATAAGIAAGDAPGMPKKSSARLVIDAVRCALSEGDYTTADRYLNSAVRDSTDGTIQAYIKLYAQWSLLCRAETVDDTNEAVIILDAYTSLPSMEPVRPTLLLTLWYSTGKQQYAETLKKQYPESLEAAVAEGTVQQLPAPFWYFVPHKGGAEPDIPGGDETAQTPAGTGPAAEKSPPVSAAGTDEKIKKQQLGLFREKRNAEELISRLKEKGFTAYSTSEVRPSGTTYYIVVVDENSDGTIGDQLRSAGFECYPVF
ncbi:MAG: SPOR domain-containing protein [Treponema sp.]|jgi:cell division septation protein DedD|nr:SPOR domain-containing protein [Treponema sp.]